MKLDTHAQFIHEEKIATVPGSYDLSTSGYFNPLLGLFSNLFPKLPDFSPAALDYHVGNQVVIIPL